MAHLDLRSNTTTGSEKTGQRTLTAAWKGGGRTYPLPTLTARVGRDGGCDIVIDHPSVSRHHATITFAIGGALVWIEDMGSRNGTRVAGRALKRGERVAFPEGVMAELGDAVLYHRVGTSGPETSRPNEDDLSKTGGGDVDFDTPMGRANRLIELVADSDISVILRGETGSGKEVYARKIHALSKRSGGPFVGLNCGALAESLLESELFGVEKGAFTGAHVARTGLLESATGGTLFLDELGEMPLSTQVKLLRALELREVVPVGGTRPRSFDARFVAATHQPLDELVSDGKFRADLYYRLNGITLELPPLRERLDEIPSLVQKFAPHAAFSAAAIEALNDHDWPGNVRELRNVVDRALVLARGKVVGREHILLQPRTTSVTPPRREEAPAVPAPVDGTERPTGSGLQNELDAFERNRILQALQESSGNQTRAAELLGLSRRTLLHRMQLHKISGPRRLR